MGRPKKDNIPGLNTPGLNLWDRLPEETSKSYEAFSLYLQYGIKRSLLKVENELKKSHTLIARWSGKYDWVKRAAAWDAEQERLAREASTQEIIKMRKRHADLSRRALEKIGQALESIDPENMTTNEIARLLDVASKLESKSLGDTTEVVEERDGGPAIPVVQFYMPDNGRDKGGE